MNKLNKWVLFIFFYIFLLLFVTEIISFISDWMKKKPRACEYIVCRPYNYYIYLQQFLKLIKHFQTMCIFVLNFSWSFFFQFSLRNHNLLLFSWHFNFIVMISVIIVSGVLYWMVLIGCILYLNVEKWMIV